MKVQLPGEIEASNGVSVVLDDGRLVHISGDGTVCVARSADALGISQEYSLVLPAIEHVVAECDAPLAETGNGHMTITVEHRH